MTSVPGCAQPVLAEDSPGRRLAHRGLTSFSLQPLKVPRMVSFLNSDGIFS